MTKLTTQWVSFMGRGSCCYLYWLVQDKIFLFALDHHSHINATPAG